jgi:anti-sigma B factor antagonist
MLAIERNNEGAVVLAGRLDAAQSPALQAFLEKIQGPVTLDCAALEYVSSAGLGVLLQAQKRLMASGGKVKLVGVSRHVRDIFKYSGFDRIFEIESSK